MSSSENLREAITELFQTEFGTKKPAVVVDYENRPFRQPVGLPWVKLWVLDAGDMRENIGNELHFKTIGVVNCQIMVPEKTGTAEMRSIKDALTAIFVDRKINMTNGSITFQGSGEFRPPREIAGWYSRSYQIPFRARWNLSR